MVRVGVIGCGKIAQVRHLPEYEANSNAQITAVFDMNYDRACEIAKAYGAVAYKTLEELLASDVDAVSVCTANANHAASTIAALKAGKHVLCEKPMAITIDECEQMVAEARAAGKKLMIDQNQRFARAHVRVKELLDAGKIGDVLSTTARVTTLDKRDPQGNLVGVDDNAICVYTMSGGTIGSMTASWTYYGPEDNSTVLYGTRGVMRIYDDPAHSIVVDLACGEHETYDVEAIQTNDNQTASGIIDAFVDCLENDTDPAISGESVLAAMRAVFGSIESSKTGTVVNVKQG